MRSKRLSLLVALLLAVPMMAKAAETRPWRIYLLFGQSNMTGGATPGPEDVFNNPRVKVLAYNNCSGRTYNQWYLATGFLHCSNGFGIGDWFGKIVADSLKQDTIALIPCAIAGVDIDFFRKDIVSGRRGDFQIPPDNHWAGAYPWMLERLKKAQEKGVISGILLHQGEADWTAVAQKVWPDKVAGIITDLKKDLGFDDVPVLIGELRADSKACCGGNNAFVAEAAKTVPNGHVISSSALTVNDDPYHFDGPGLREFGKRYAASYLQAIKTSSSATRPGVYSPAHWHMREVSGARTLEFNQAQDRILIRDSEGRRIAEGSGRAMRLPNSGKHGLLFFQAAAGTEISSGTLLDLP